MKPQPPKPLNDVTPTLARQVIDLYADELTEVRFPDLDLSALLDAQAELHAAQLDVESLETELANKRAELELRSQALLAKAERALAYARIFAQGDEALAPRLAEIGRRRSGSHGQASQSISTSGAIAAPKRRGRKPKAEEEPEELFAQPASA